MSNFRGRGGRGGRGGFGGRAVPKGSFRDGVWHCECNPPLPAVHFLVKKEGPNKGRWFRTCQKPQDQRCGFFLWDSDAHPRENAALQDNSPNEPARAATTTPRTQRVASPPPPYTPDAGPSDGRKRDRAPIQDEEDEFDLGGNADFDEELDQVMAAAETPSKKPRTDAFATPPHPARRKLPWQTDNARRSNKLPTPQTEQRISNDVFSTRPAPTGGSLLTPSRYHSDESRTVSPSSSFNGTPTPALFKDVGTPSVDNDLVGDVLRVLQDANVQMNDQTRKNLTAVLSRHAIIAEGVKKGRDAARASTSAKTAKVTELTYRVSTLEAELEAEKAKVSHLQWSLEHGQQSD